MHELSANAVISTSRSENDAAAAAGQMTAIHPVSGPLTDEEVASAIDVALDETSDALQNDEESLLWAIKHHSRGAAAGPSGWTLKCLEGRVR